MPMGELLLRVELAPQHVLQLFTLQLSTPALSQNQAFETESRPDGAVERGKAPISEDEAIVRLKGGNDIVVCSQARRANRNKARELTDTRTRYCCPIRKRCERRFPAVPCRGPDTITGYVYEAAFGDFEEDPPHEGRMALPHFHPRSRNPEVHAFL
jgi:hypothetical protein